MGVVFFGFSIYFLCFMLVEALVNSCGALLLGASQVNILYLFGLLVTAFGFALYGFLGFIGRFYARMSYLFSLVSFVTGIIFLHTDNKLIFVLTAYCCLLFLGIYGGYAHGLLTRYVNTPKFGICLGVSMAISIAVQFAVDTFFTEILTKGTVITAFLLINTAVAFLLANRKLTGKETVETGKANNSISELVLGILLVAVMSIILGMEDSLMVAKNAAGDVGLFSYVRLLYAVGLVLAGLVTDVGKGKYLGLCAAASVILSTFAIGILEYDEVGYNLSMAIMYFYCGFYVMFLTYEFVKCAGKTMTEKDEKAGMFFSCSALVAGMGRITRCVFTGLTVFIMSLIGDNFSFVILLGASCFFSIVCLLIAFVRFNKSNSPAANVIMESEFPEAFNSMEKSSMFTKERFDEFANNYQLTDKEREIFEILITTETATQEIADMLSISRRGLQRHVASIYEKTGTQTRVGLLICFTNLKY